ncbi:hypothetical protein CNMCM5623_000432 [Aspergillus felis]|uniref:Cytochrome P450 n=1 Tax=Aspergillus felis TaxID=1287682 RepID=A0A8H6UXZ2_9EURO|nr:hypothetical protein CNMCM5623_000432 [Aspergillus felis]
MGKNVNSRRARSTISILSMDISISSHFESLWVAALVLAVFVAFRALKDSLSSIPGPWYTAWTGVILQYRWIKGQRPRYVHSLHQKFGPVVRVGPAEVDICDLDAVKEIHKVGGGFLKSEWYRTLTMNGVKNLFSIRDPKEHNMRRRLLAPPMSESSLKTVEPVIQALAQLTIHRMREEMDKRGAADIFKWWMFMTMDIIAELSFGTTFGLLKQGEKNQYAMDLEKIPAFGTYRSAFPKLVETARILPLPFFRDIAQAGRRMRGYADECINNYRKLVSREPSSPKPTLFAKLFEATGHGALTHDEIRNEAQGYIIAGSDTRATTLTYLVWSVCQHGEVQQTLVEELAALPDEIGNDDAKRLPYLNQVINETLRLYAATPSGLPRTVPDPGVKLAGHWIPGGVTVTTQAYSLHRDSSVFP